MLIRNIVFGSVLPFVLLAARPAQACSLPCSPPVRLFGPRVEVPANLIYFKVLEADPGPLELRDAAGALVPASIRTIGHDRVFAPESPPASGQKLTLHYRGCNAQSPSTYEFSVRDPAPTELRPAELAVMETGVASPGLPNNEALFVRFRFYPPDEAGSASHLFDYTVTVDGRWVRFDDSWSAQGMHVFDVASACLPVQRDWSMSTCGDVFRAPPGRHTVTVETRMVGADKDPGPVSMTIDTSCGQVIRTSASADGRQLPNSGVAKGEGSDPGAAPGSTPMSSGGCSFAAGQPAPGAGAVAFLLLALVRRGRRRAR